MVCTHKRRRLIFSAGALPETWHLLICFIEVAMVMRTSLLYCFNDALLFTSLHAKTTSPPVEVSETPG